jgi:hypothetical protein
MVSAQGFRFESGGRTRRTPGITSSTWPGLLDTLTAGQYKAKENAYRENSNLSKPREETLLARPLDGQLASPSQLPHPHDDAAVRGLSLAYDTEMSRAGMAQKRWC